MCHINVIAQEYRFVAVMNVDRLSFGYQNPNHAAALICALMPLCWGWRRCAWIGRGLGGRAAPNLVVPVHPLSRFPADFDFAEIDRVMLFGDCQEWAHLVRGIPVECVED